MTKFKTALLFSFICTLFACSSADEQDALAKAQKCLDEVTVGNYSEADACLQYVEKYTSQQASIIKCSIYMVSGGLMEDKILAAYKASKDDTITNKETAFMAMMALDQPNLTSGLTKAQSAEDECTNSGVPSLKYLANIIVAGTAIAKTIASFGTTITVNTPPATISAAVQTMLADCTGATPNTTNCNENLQVIGTAVATLSASYCASDSADDEVCDQIKQATDAAGNNATNVGQALLCYMNNKTFNPSTGLCN